MLHLCSLGAVPFAYPADDRPILPVNLAHLAMPVAAGDVGVGVEELAAAVFNRLRALTQSSRTTDEPRRQRSRHNAGSGAAEDDILEPLPDIIVSSNPPSPASTTDSGLDSPREDQMMMFSFDADDVAEYANEASSSPSVDRVMSRGYVAGAVADADAMHLAPPPPSRDRRTGAGASVANDDEGLGGEDGDDEDFDDSRYAVAAKELPSPPPTPSASSLASRRGNAGKKTGYESVVIDMPSDSDNDDFASGVDFGNDGGVARRPNGRRVDRRWKKIGRDLRNIADEFQYSRTGETTVQPWTVNFSEFIRLLFGFFFGRLVRRWLGF